MEKIKHLPFVVLLGIVALGFLYFLSFYGEQKAPPQSRQDEARREVVTQGGSAAQPLEAPSLSQGASALPENQEKKQFQAQLKELFQRLPRKGFADQEDVHSTPQSLLKAAIEVGKVSDRYQQFQILKPEALSFYTECAKDADVIPQIRAVCYERAQALTFELEGKKLSLKLPQEVLDLVGR